MLVGQGATVDLPGSSVVTREIDLRGTIRSRDEFGRAAALVREGGGDLSPLLSHLVPVGDAVAAFDLTMDKRSSMKAQLSFE